MTFEWGFAHTAPHVPASAAALVAYPNIAKASARQMGYENLTKLYIRAWILAQLEDRWKPMQMGGDEALALVVLAELHDDAA